jgi:hypothetical protein
MRVIYLIRFISAGKSENLIDKISSLGSIYQKEQIKPRIYAADRIKTDNPQLYYVIDKLIEAAQTNRQVRFRYTEYDADRNEVLRNYGEICVNSPYGCL